MQSSGISFVFWFIAIAALIPLSLWLLKRTPMGGAAAQGVMRSVAMLPLSPSQRLVTVEVGQGDQRKWLVLGVTGQTITTLHTMEPQGDVPGAAAAAQMPAFAQMLRALRRDKGTTGEH